MKWLYSLLGAIIIFGLTIQGMNVSRDSLTYLTSADYFHNAKIGLGFTTIFPDHAPLYAMFLGALQWLCGQVTGKQTCLLDINKNSLEVTVTEHPIWARLAGMICFGTLVGLMYSFGREFGGVLSGHVTALLTVLVLPLTHIFTYIWSEALFLPLTVATLYCLYRGLVGKHRVCFWLAAVFAGLCLFTRFLGVAVLLTGMVTMALFYPRRLAMKQTLWMVIACSPLLLYVSIDRVTAPATQGVLSQGWQCVKVGYQDLGPILLLLVVGSLVLRRCRLWWPMGLYVLIYLVLLIGGSSTILIDPIDTRLLVPIYPILILCVSLFIQTYRKKVVSGMAEGR